MVAPFFSDLKKILKQALIIQMVCNHSSIGLCQRPCPMEYNLISYYSKLFS